MSVSNKLRLIIFIVCGIFVTTKVSLVLGFAMILLLMSGVVDGGGGT